MSALCGWLNRLDAASLAARRRITIPFIRASLDERDLAPSPEADRRTLIRRVTYDLTGLPPTPEDVQDFIDDASPDAYARLVDRLLASPRYGERWGRHWLDVVHYADTHGYDKDKRRPNAWPYRDYVIRSLNDDKPYGRFVEEQVAGDALFPDDPQGTVATGFLAAGPWDFVGHVELREGTKDKKITRLLDRDDMLSNVMSTFSSLTVHCARCHQHKFDPISQEDYYSLQAVFAGVDRAERPYDRSSKAFLRRQQLSREREAVRFERDMLQAQLDAFRTPELDGIAKRLAEVESELDTLRRPDSPSNGYHSAIEPKADTTKWVQIDLGRITDIDRIRLVAARPTDFPDTPGFGFPVRFTIEVSDTADFAAPVALADYTEADYPGRTDRPYELTDIDARARYLRVTATRLWKRSDDYVFALAEAEVFSNGFNVAAGAAVSAYDTIDAGRWHTRYLTDGYDSRRRIGTVEDSDALSSLRAERIRLRVENDDLRRAMLSETARERLAVCEARLEELDEAFDSLPEPSLVYAAATDFKKEGNFSPAGAPRAIHVLHRGDVEQPGERAVPGTVGCLPHLDHRFEDAEDEGARRAALARWLTSPENALTWRSIVNRVWHYHFGAGLVDTPNDFGRMGAPPTHPELLDWLAVYFLENGQSLKALHTLMVTSATYRQASSGNDDFARIDGGNRFLWRMNRTQLDAESLRDSMLAVSGLLDLTMGGPGYDLFAFEDDHSPRYLYAEHEPLKGDALRRSVYRFIVRSVPDPFMTTLDCADPSQSVPVRTHTITALQALSMMNNPSVVTWAEAFAERVSSEADDLEGQLDAAFEYALARRASDTERATLAAYAEEHGLAAACRLIFNLNEFMFVD